jgi:hypothetical protein
MATFILLHALLQNAKKFTNHKKLLALLVVLTLLAPQLSQLFISQAHAGTMTPAKVMINNSQAGASNVTYSFRFTTTATTAIKQWTIQLCTAASGTCTAPTGLVNSGAAIASDNIAGTGRTNTFNSDGTLTTVVTSPAAQSTQAVAVDYTGITNPTTPNTTYYARITTYSDTGSTVIDTATVAFAILDTTSIAVTANVDASFTFSIAGIAGTGSNTVNGATLTNGITTTATTIPFGTMAVGAAKVAAQDLTVSTNAQNGYTITASHSATAVSGTPPLVSGSNDIDTFTGTNASPVVWSAPTSTTANSNSGFFGYTTESTSLCTGTAGRFATNKWAGTSTTGAEVACSATPVNSTTTRIGYQLQVDAYQPAGSYAGTVVLVATPTY